MATQYKCVKKCQLGQRLYKPGQILLPGVKPNKYFQKVGVRPVAKASPPVEEGVSSSSPLNEGKPAPLSSILAEEESQRDEVSMQDAAEGDKPSSIFE